MCLNKLMPAAHRHSGSGPQHGSRRREWAMHSRTLPVALKLLQHKEALHRCTVRRPMALAHVWSRLSRERPPLQVLQDTRALMLNGFVLDELPGPLVVAAALQTRAAGGSVFFDPGQLRDQHHPEQEARTGRAPAACLQLPDIKKTQFPRFILMISHALQRHVSSHSEIQLCSGLKPAAFGAQDRAAGHCSRGSGVKRWTPSWTSRTWCS